MKKRKILALLIALVMAGALFAGCGGGNNADTSSSPTTSDTASAGSSSNTSSGKEISKTFVIGVGYRPSSIDPHDCRNYSTTVLLDFIHETLIYSNHDGTGYFPRLAESWFPNEDGSEWTFNLRKDVTFHKSNNPFTADDVVYSVDRIKNPDNNLYLSVVFQDLERVEKIDDYTVKFVFRMSMPEGESYFTGMTAIRFIDSKAHQEMGDDYFNLQYCSGTGPWMLEEWIDGQHAYLKKAPNYWDKENYDPYFDEIYFRTLSEPASAIAAHISGSIQGYAANGGISNDLKGLYDDYKDKIDVISIQGSSFVNMIMNLKDGSMFQNDKFREAFHLAINRQLIIDTIFNGAADMPIGAYHSASMGYDESLGPIKYDPERAKQLLAEIGYDGRPVEFQYSNTMSQGEEMAMAILDMENAVGINLDVQFEDHSVMTTRTTEGDFEVYIIAGSVGDGLIIRTLQESLLLSNQSRIQQWPRYPEWEALVQEVIDAGMDMDKVNEVGKKINAFRFENYFYNLPLVYRHITQALDKGIVGIDFYSDGLACFAYVDWDPSLAP